MNLTGSQRRALHVLANLTDPRGGYISNATSAGHGGIVASPTAASLEDMGLVEIEVMRGASRIRLTVAGATEEANQR